ncbi:glutaredoxin family protein [Bacillus proteolyticus]|uniref:glutaredoxin family protein n=1 Tax=Bacillus proteolyticus TaxID=2026192 RepID=UPI0030F39B04
MAKEVILYGSDGCGFCVRAKAWLEAKSVLYTMKDLKEEANRTEFQQYNEDGIPLLIIKDHTNKTEEKIVGFTEERYSNKLL